MPKTFPIRNFRPVMINRIPSANAFMDEVNNKSYKRFIQFLTLFLLLISCKLNAQVSSYTGAGTYTWTCPVGVTSVGVQCWGAGGAGGGVSSNGTYYGNGGAGGSYSFKIFTVIPGNLYTVTVGAGGAIGTGTGGNGGNSWFNTTATIIASGGAGGLGNNASTPGVTAGSSTGNIGSTIFKGGDGGNGPFALGAGGGGAGSTGNGGSSLPGSPYSAGSGTSSGGGNGAAGIVTTGSGLPGNGAGGGGSGASTTTGANYKGGLGGDGRVDITPPPVILSFSPTSSCSGSGATITITGSNFTNCTSVSFNGVSAIFSITNANTISAQLPSGAATGTISVINPGGTATSATSLTVYTSVSGLTYTNTSPAYCTGSVITTNSASITGGGTITYSVSPALPAGLILNTSTGTISGTPSAAATAASYVITASNGCSSTTANLNITVNSPMSGLSYTSLNSTYCTGNPITANSASVTGTNPTYSVSPALPAGLSLNVSTGAITGTPTTVSGSTNYTITAGNGCGSATRSINITVITGMSALTYVSTTVTYCTNTAITNNTVAGVTGSGTITYSVSPALPSGLSLNSSNGIISGTPSSTSTAANYTITASNGCSSATTIVNITVIAQVSGLTYTANAPTYCTGVTITSNSVSGITGGGTISYAVSPALPAGLSLNAATGSISGTPSAASSGSYTITASNSCSSTTATLNITVITGVNGLSYSNPGPLIYCIGSMISNNNATVSGGGSVTFAISPSLPSGLSFNNGNGQITGNPSSSSSAMNYTVTASNSCSSSGIVLNITINTPVSGLSYTNNTITYCTGAVITTNMATVTGSGTITYSVSPTLPAGLSLNTATGAVTGTPTAASAATSYTITATNSCSSTSKAINITVITGMSSLSYSTPGPVTYCTGAVITTNTATVTGGGTITYSVSPALPAGLSLNTSTGAITGTPTAASAAASYTITASNNCSSTTASVNITVITTLSSLSYSIPGPVTYCTGAVITTNTATVTGSGTITYSVSPTLPLGLSLNTSTGAITGTPTVASAAASYTITATNSCSSTTKAINITIINGMSGLSYSTPGPVTYCTGAVITTNTASVTGGGTITYSVSPALPAGLSLNTSTGAITGTPTAASAAASYTITASNSCSSTTVSVNITVITTVASLSYSTPGPVTYCTGAVITTNTATVTGGGTITYSVSPALPAGLSLNTSTGAVTGTPTAASAAASYTITASNNCSFTTASVNITVITTLSSLSYSTPGPVTYCTGAVITTNTATVTGSGTITYSVSPALPAGLSLNTATGAVTGTPTAASAATSYTITATNSCSSTSKAINITVITGMSSLSYSTPGPVTYCTGAVITTNMATVTGSGTITYSVSPTLPAGLSLNTATGAITGTPTAASAATSYTITASNNCSSTTVSVNIAVITTLSSLSYSTPGPVTYCTGAAITTNTATVTGSGTITYSVSPALPAGLSLNTSTGAITGTPTAASAATSYTITATNSCSSTTKAINITIINGMSGLSYSTPGPVTYCTGAAITTNTATVTGSGTITYSVSPALPSGVSLNTSTGAITGTPTAASAATSYTITASNNCSSTTVSVNIAVITTLSSLSYSTPGPVTYCTGAAITTNTATVTGSGTITYSVSPALPAGLSLNTSTGAITGTPTAASAATSYTITASNNCSSTTVSVNIAVITTLSSLSYSTPGPVTYCTGAAITTNTATVTGSGTITYSVSSALPAGLSLNTSTGAITGTPTAAMAATAYTITASNNCSSTTITLIITISAAPAIIAANTSPVCSGTSLNFTATSGVGYGYVWSGPNGYSSSAQNPSLTYTTAAAGTYTVIATSSAGCVASASTIVTSSAASGQWIGGFSSNWGTGDNWCDGNVPSISTNIAIPATATNMPVVSDNETAQNILINTGASLTVNTTGTLQVSGSISNSGVFDVSNGTIEMTGSVAQAIPNNVFVNNALTNLIISNRSASGVSLSGPLDIYGSVTFSGTGMTLNTNDNITFKSTATYTAWLGDITGNTVTGQATVERYISAHKAWQFLSIPTNTTQTTKQTWQEGALTSASNPVPGFGTQVTSNSATWSADGFDLSSASPSMKTYNSTSNAWVGIANTNSTGIKTTGGYLLFVRGDRSVTSASATPTSTILRTKGPLYTNDQPAISIGSSQFVAIGNPFASALDMRNITKAGLKDFFYLWDPGLAGTSGYGGYQTFSSDGNGNYVVTPGGGSYPSIGTVSNYIKSGLAFFVQGTVAGGTITLKEGAKSSGSGQLAAPVALTRPQLRITLIGSNADNSTYVADGALINYADNYSNAVDDMDALKSNNTSENLAIKTANKLLVVERRHTIINTDTSFLNISNLKIQNYSFQFIAEQLYKPGMVAYLMDNYLKTKTPVTIDGNTTINFTVTSTAASYASNRFMIVFAQSGTLPVTFTSIQAFPMGATIAVTWKVDNESNILKYDLEKSLDGTQFNKIATMGASANNMHTASYKAADLLPAIGWNYYRVKSVDLSGNFEYTSVVKVLIAPQDPVLSVYPNPVANSTIHIQMTNEPGGLYVMRLTNSTGQVTIEKSISHAGGNASYELQLPKGSARGIYHLEINNRVAGTRTIRMVY